MQYWRSVSLGESPRRGFCCSVRHTVTDTEVREKPHKQANPKPFPMAASVTMASVCLVGFDGSSSSAAAAAVIGHRQFNGLAYFVTRSSS